MIPLIVSDTFRKVKTKESGIWIWLKFNINFFRLQEGVLFIANQIKDEKILELINKNLDIRYPGIENDVKVSFFFIILLFPIFFY